MTDDQVEQVVEDVLAVIEAHRQPRYGQVAGAVFDQPSPG
jgi:uncharacterized protein YejL (UPF0352 family)